MRFVFTHRGMHGGWCWKYVLEELAALGLSAIAADLRGHGERANEPVTLDGYRDACSMCSNPTTCSPLWNINSPDSGRRRSIRPGPRILL